jgi:hypothetical protein
MPTRYVVQPGDYLARIAAGAGFRDWSVIWNDPANAELKKLRKHPHILQPGDVVVIPDMSPKTAGKPTGQMHQFTVSQIPVRLRLKVSRQFRKPEKIDAALALPEPLEAVAADDQGVVTARLPAKLEDTTLELDAEPISVRIGFLAPITTPAGWRDRLNNLGYRAGTSEDPKDPKLKSAIEEFQCDQGLAVDGVCGSATQDKLVAIHGC